MKIRVEAGFAKGVLYDKNVLHLSARCDVDGLGWDIASGWFLVDRNLGVLGVQIGCLASRFDTEHAYRMHIFPAIAAMALKIRDAIEDINAMPRPIDLDAIIATYHGQEWEVDADD